MAIVHEIITVNSPINDAVEDFIFSKKRVVP